MTNQTQTVNKTHEAELHDGIPMESLGEIDIQIDVDEETYERAHEMYLAAVDRGYTDGFDLFLLNNCSRSRTITVDGEPLDPRE